MPLTTTTLPKEFRDNHLNADGLISSRLITDNQSLGAWKSDVDAGVRLMYAERGIHGDAIKREMDLEIESHLVARAKAVQELTKAIQKGTLSSKKLGDELAFVLTTLFIERYYTFCSTHSRDRNADSVINLFKLALGPEFLSAARPTWARPGHHLKRDENPGVDGYVNLYSIGLTVARVIIDAIGGMADRENPKKQNITEIDLCRQIGEACNREIQAIGFARLNIERWNADARKLPAGISRYNAFMRLTRAAERRTNSQIKSRRIKQGDIERLEEYDDLRLPTEHDYLEKWNDDKAKQVGAAYVDLFKSAGFLKVFGIKSGNGHSVDIVQLTPDGHKLAADVIQKNLGSAYCHMPMTIPPVPHSAYKGGVVDGREVGGYLLDAYAKTNRQTISHSKLKKHTTQKVLDSGAEPEWVQALNMAQDQPMALNEHVADVINSLRRDGAPVSEGEKRVMNVHSLTLLAAASADDVKHLKDSYNAKRNNIHPDAAVSEADRCQRLLDRSKVIGHMKSRITRLHEQAIKERGSASRIATVFESIELLRKFNSTERFWIVWFCDSRRRFYGLGALNPIEREVCKALLLLADPLEVTDENREQVRYDLLWQIATTWGSSESKELFGAKSDKLSESDRAAWAATQIETIKLVAENPLSFDAFRIWAGELDRDHLGREVIAGGAGDPYSFMAACREYFDLFLADVPRTNTRFAITKDCTASGLQMASLSACSKSGAELVNAYPGAGIPADIYVKVFAKAAELLTNGFTYKNGFTYVKVLPDSGIVGRVDAYGIGRSAAKPVVMTCLYSASSSTNRQAVLDAMVEDGNPFIPRFKPFDSAAQQVMTDALTRDVELAKEAGDVERAQELAQVANAVNRVIKIKLEDKQLVLDAEAAGETPPSVMKLFTPLSDEAPQAPNEAKYDLKTESGAEKYEFEMALYNELKEAWDATPHIRDQHNREVAERVDAVQTYLNAVRAAHGLSPLVRKVGQIYASDLDPLIKNLTEALREGLAQVAPSIVNFRDVIKAAVKDEMDWSQAERQDGALIWDMPHGWRTSQRHTIHGDADRSKKLMVFSSPTPPSEKPLQYLAQAVHDAIESGEDCEALKPHESQQYWTTYQVPPEQREVDKAEHLDAIVANVCHSTDSALLTELKLQLHKRGVPNQQVHDCFWTRIGEGHILKAAMGDAVAKLFGADIGAERPLDLFAKSLGIAQIVPQIRRTTDHEDYFDPSALAGGTAENFIC